ncbi:hypothetical protein UPYG_G00302390 [Umbra pygmaea]|uniref:AIG1-type G domain-containing protein n=1 Tax=Umbra pygmaea TaxID=75934 RepID=A0ABD0W6K9_UMBPY
MAKSAVELDLKMEREALRALSHPAVKTKMEEKEREMENMKKTLRESEEKIKEKDSTLEEKNKELMEKDSTLEEMRKELMEKDSTLEEMRKELKDTESKLEKTIKQINETIKHLQEKDKQLDYLTQQVREKERSLENTVKEVEKSQRQVEELRKNLQDKNIQVENFSVLLQEKELQLEDRNHRLGERDYELKERIQELEQKDKLMEEREYELEEKDKLLEQREYELKERRQELEEKDKLLEKKEKQLKEKDQLEDVNKEDYKLAQQIFDGKRLRRETSVQMTVEEEASDTDHRETPRRRRSREQPPEMAAESNVLVSPVSPTRSELRHVLLGRSGSQRKFAGNTILGREEFGAQASPSALTQRIVKTEGDVCGRSLVMLDTPDWFCPGLSLEDMRQDVGLCVRLSAPGPHAFLLVIPVETSKEEDKGLLERMEDMFGEGCWGHTVILFTHDDSLKEQSIEEFLQVGSQDLQQLVEKCGSRYHVLNINPSSSIDALERQTRLSREPYMVATKAWYRWKGEDQKINTAGAMVPQSWSCFLDGRLFY